MLREAQKRGQLRVATLNSPTTYYQDREGPAGFEYDLARAYAAHLGLKLEMKTARTIKAVLDDVSEDRADLAAAGLTITAQRKKHFRFGPPYLYTKTLVVCARRGVQPHSLDELKTVKLRVAPGSAYVALLQKLQRKMPDLRFEISDGDSVEALLSQIGRTRNFCTLADSHVFAQNRRYLPELVSPMALGGPQPIAWALGGGISWRSVSLQRDVDAWFALPQTQELLKTLKERYFEVADTEFDYVDLARFRRAMRSRLPRYKNLFVRAGKRYNLPWPLLAAISWRESHWNPKARSHTGVRGMMMLTRQSAREAGISNRLDAAQSIQGGARYFARLLRRLPPQIKGEERYWFALAAYNMGYGHLTDARMLAARRGLDPNRWRNVRSVLDALEDPHVYKTLPRGYAHGHQARHYVAAVRNFYDILRQREQQTASH